MTPWVRTLLTANIVMFFATQAFPEAARQLVLFPPLALFRPWTMVTYMFLHAGLGHLFFNMLGLFFFGSRLENRLGGQRFLSLYLVSGLVGALASLIFTPGAAVLGASGAIFGVMLGYARYWPRDLVLIWGIFPVQARWLVVGMTVLSLMQGFGGTGGNVAHFAHLGGFLGGLVYLVWMERRSPARQFRVMATVQTRGGNAEDIERWMRIRPEGLHELNRGELERLQQKIAAGEARELTPDERAFLNRLAAAPPPPVN
ncbi:MAG: rhomboid family intramembrane serine protease [Gemmatimonadetes bacterium]|nr:rhomboid family intramembrane serine protease [Gemmatimonadota bacterium]